MAVWQFDFYIIKEENIKFYNESLSCYENEVWLSWEKEKIKGDSIKKISKILPPEKSWSNKIMQYGKIDETCLEIFTLDDGLYQICIRLDLRSMNDHILLEIIDFIHAHKAIVVCDNKCYQIDKEVLVKIIKESNAFKYIENPYEYLINL